MGIVRMGPPQDIVLYLKQTGAIRTLVETGTYYGATAEWAAAHFDSVITVEFSDSIYQKTSEKYAHLSNIEFLFGDSRQQLTEILPKLCEPAMFWLDAHWCSFGSYGETDQCPLLDELNIIMDSPFDHIILIDDARLFMYPPPAPNLPAYYPDITSILTISSAKNMYSVIYEDVIIVVPISMKAAFSAFMHEKATQDQEHFNQLYKYKVRLQKAKDNTKAVLWPVRFLWSKS